MQSGPQLRPRSVWPMVGVMTATVLGGGLLLVGRDQADARRLVGGLLTCLDVGSLVLLWQRSRECPAERRGWQLIATSILFSLVSTALLAARDRLPGSGDAAGRLYIGLNLPFHVLNTAGLLSFPWRRSAARQRHLLALGSTLFVGSLLLLLWLADTARLALQGPTPVNAVLVGTCVRLSLVGGVTLYLLTEDPRRVRGPLGWQAAGALAVGFVTALLQRLSTTGQVALPLLALALVNPFTFMISAWSRIPVEPASETRARAPAWGLLVYGPYLVAGAALAFGQLLRPGVLSGPVLGFIGLTGLLVARQFLLLREASLSRDTLEERVQERTRRLGEAVEDLRSQDRNKSQFLAMLSHELRNPLTPILNSIYLLDRAVPGGPQALRAQAVLRRQVGHLARIVDDLLDMTRIAGGKIKLQREPADLREVLRRTLEDHRSQFEANGVELEVALGQEARVLADPTRLAQALGNVVNNAAKFTPPRGQVRISLERDLQVGQAIVRIRDTGAGIAAALLPRLFDPFVQADTGLARTRGGLGLGLAVAKEFVEMHGGTVTAQSQGLGAGAEFTIRLPLSEAAPAPAATAAAAAGGPPQRVLVIEDNVDAAESVREVLGLGERRVEVAIVCSGDEGLTRAPQFRPDVVLCDIGLPGMDGYAVAQAFRSDEVLCATYLVALTGYAMPGDVERAREAGFDQHLAKPASPERLERVLAVAAGRPGAAHPAASVVGTS